MFACRLLILVVLADTLSLSISIECVRGLKLGSFLSSSQQARLGSRPGETAALLASTPPPSLSAGAGSNTQRAIGLSNSTLQSAGASSTRSGGISRSSSLFRFSLFGRARSAGDALRLKLQLDNSSDAVRRHRTSAPTKLPTLAKSDPILVEQASSPGSTTPSGDSADANANSQLELERKKLRVTGLACELVGSSVRSANKSERIFSDALLVLRLKRKSKCIASQSYSFQQLLRLSGTTSSDERSAAADAERTLPRNDRSDSNNTCILSSRSWLQLGITNEKAKLRPSHPFTNI